MSDHAVGAASVIMATGERVARHDAGEDVEESVRPRRWRLADVLAASWLILVVALALAADLLPLPPYDRPVGRPAMGPSVSIDFLLGTDTLGRSNLSRVVYGARVSLIIGVVSVAIGMVFGGLIGLLSGYARGRIESITNVLIDSVLAFPPLVVLLAITATMGSSVRNLVLALGVLSVPTFARLARANTLAYAQREFIVAARAMGARSRRIVFRELLPNVIQPVASYAFVVAAVVMVAEGSLSFLGLGVPAPTPTWGGMIAAAKDRLETDPFMVAVPAIAMFLTILSLNVLGDRLRNRFDARELSL